MKIRVIALAILLALVFTTCQKDSERFPGTNNIFPLLEKTVYNTGQNSVVTTYTYDSERRLIKEQILAGNNPELRINRNAAGIIITTGENSPLSEVMALDSIATHYNYDNSLKRYTSSVSYYAGGDRDSIVYIYDNNERIVSDEHYGYNVNSLPQTLIPNYRNTYTFSTSSTGILVNVLNERRGSTGGFESYQVLEYVYDSKINPLRLLNETILLSSLGLYNSYFISYPPYGLGLYSANNTTKIVYTKFPAPESDFTLDYIYNYNLLNLPDSSTAIRTPGGDITTTKYYYK